MRTMTIIIPDEKPVSWNKYYSGDHWSKRNNEAKRVHWLVRAHLDPESPIFNTLVDIEVVVYFENNKVRLDASNITAKFYEDGLIGYLIENDSWRQVRSMKTVTLLDRVDPRVEIIITEATTNPIHPGWLIEIIEHFTEMAEAETTTVTAREAIYFAKAALAMLGDVK